MDNKIKVKYKVSLILVNNKNQAYLVNRQVNSPLSQLLIFKDQLVKVTYLVVLQLSKQIKELDLYLVVLLIPDFLEWLLMLNLKHKLTLYLAAQLNLPLVDLYLEIQINKINNLYLVDNHKQVREL